MIEFTDHVVNEQARDRAVRRCRERGIILPTFAQMQDPGRVPVAIRDELKTIGLWDVHPRNLFRISWHNQPRERGGLYGDVPHLLLPPALTGVSAPIAMLLGKWFPTGAHKVGAAYGCLAPRLVTGQFDPTYHKAVWPSTGNYCRGGAFDSALMGCTAVAILPEGMSRERFDWLRTIGAEVIATPGCESNVKEIYDKCWEIRRTRPDCVILNQFDEFGNPCWHYHVTGAAIADVWRALPRQPRLGAYISATGSAGTIAAGDFLRTLAPHLRVVAAEALQCPTLLNNGFGAHRIEGIGDKHVPWVHNVRNTNAVAAIDDELCLRILRLFNEPVGKAYLATQGIPAALVDLLDCLGISGIANLLAAIKTAKHFEFGTDDAIITIATDAAALYASRLEELRAEHGAYTATQAACDLDHCLHGTTTDHYKELTYLDQKAIHNLKYYTWVEQQGKDIADLNRLWHDPDVWPQLFAQVTRWDELIAAFNAQVAGA